MKSKFFTVFFIFTILVLFSVNISFASTNPEDITCTEPTSTYLATAIYELQQTYPESDYYYTYGYAYGPRCYEICFFEKQYLTISPYIIGPTFTYQGYDYYQVKISNTNNSFTGYVYKILDNSYTLDGSYTYTDSVPGFTMVVNSTTPVEFTANFSVYSDSNGSDFFIAPPQTILAQVVERVEMSQEITQTIVGLAGLLIPLLVSLLAFWKGWGLLSRVLFKA